jgi:hypothetical protein
MQPQQQQLFHRGITILRSADEVGPVEYPSLGWPSFGGI